MEVWSLLLAHAFGSKTILNLKFECLEFENIDTSGLEVKIIITFLRSGLGQAGTDPAYLYIKLNIMFYGTSMRYPFRPDASHTTKEVCGRMRDMRELLLEKSTLHKLFLAYLPYDLRFSEEWLFLGSD